jgi:hypothetical protein
MSTLLQLESLGAAERLEVGSRGGTSGCGCGLLLTCDRPVAIARHLLSGSVRGAVSCWKLSLVSSG